MITKIKSKIREKIISMSVPESDTEGNYYYHQLSINQQYTKALNNIIPHCGTVFLVLYNDNRRMMIGKTEKTPIEGEVISKINRELLNQNIFPDDIIIFPFTEANIMKLMKRYPYAPTVSQFDLYLQKYFTETVYKRYPIEGHHGSYIEHFGRKDNHPIDIWQLRTLFMGLGFEWNYQNYWHLENKEGFTIHSQSIF